MRQRLLREGANELTYEIRGIVKKAVEVEKMGQFIFWENIGDPIQKNTEDPCMDQGHRGQIGTAG